MRQRRTRRGLLLAASAAPLLGAAAAEEVPAELAACARLLTDDAGPRGAEREERLYACRVVLLEALHRDRIPGYSYNPREDCLFWARYAARDRHIEGSRKTDFNKIAAYRLSEPFEPPLRRNGTGLYVGAHRGAEDGVHFHRHLGLRLHVFEPSRSFFRSLREAIGDVEGFTLHNYGLGAETQRMHLDVGGIETASRVVDPSSSSDAVPNGTEEVLIRAAPEAVAEVLGREGGEVELLHVNCEGCEYDVLEALRASRQLAGVEQVQIATHLLPHTLPGADWQEAVQLSLQVSSIRYCEMHRALSETHERAFGLPWVWERWTRRRPPGGDEEYDAG